MAVAILVANMWQTLSRRLGPLVVMVDMGKGALAVFMAQVIGLGLVLQVVEVVSSEAFLPQNESWRKADGQ
ncbi:hypothetical protein ACFLVX_01460 [Chloroflexota bacterium]